MATDEHREPAPGSTTPEPSPADQKGEAVSAASERTPLTQQVGRIVMVALAVLFGIFAVFNAQPVDFSWVFGETQVVKQADQVVSGGVPLILLLAVAFVVGAIVGRISGWRRTRRLKRSTTDTD